MVENRINKKFINFTVDYLQKKKGLKRIKEPAKETEAFDEREKRRQQGDLNQRSVD